MIVNSYYKLTARGKRHKQSVSEIIALYTKGLKQVEICKKLQISRTKARLSVKHHKEGKDYESVKWAVCKCDKCEKKFEGLWSVLVGKEDEIQRTTGRGTSFC